MPSSAQNNQSRKSQSIRESEEPLRTRVIKIRTTTKSSSQPTSRRTDTDPNVRSILDTQIQFCLSSGLFQCCGGALCPPFATLQKLLCQISNTLPRPKPNKRTRFLFFF